ncbi:MAG: efflux RND transporter periplasmic adaptor subunit [Methylocystis sp.]|nr:efflux RND transporter periplasmic adaptor subunit [Methylocystis sp.]MCA3589834.1 efflux RND transporter periplasmic adaptor subunit [Methylocystis sp.]MCA3592346.1 efflux RND transporter periplasmic adaptor subunit [Methylocystis sp.]
MNAAPSQNLRFIRSPILAALLCVGLASCSDGKGSTADKPAERRSVVARPVVFEPRVTNRSFVGIVRPKVESDLGFRVSGKVAERLVQAGDKVKAGQPLARLDTVDFQLHLEQAKAERDAATANLVQAEAEDRRVLELRRNGWSTAATEERQRAVVEEAKGRLARAERAVSLAANSLAYTTLAADADGIVTATMIEPGQVVAQGVPAIRLAKIESREAVASIPEFLIDRVKTAKATVSLWSEPGKSYAAKLRELSPSADPNTRTYLARFTILDPPANLEFGQTATVTLSDPDSERVVRLPLSALFNQGKGPSVYTVDPNSGVLTLKPVEVVAYETSDVLLRKGVESGDMVVTLGVQKLDASQRVRIVGQ